MQTFADGGIEESTYNFLAAIIISGKTPCPQNTYFCPHLIKNRYIRNFTAGWLLAIFALSNTPIKVLHHFFANHIDEQTIVHYRNGQPQLQVAGIDCHVETNVVINPYICYGGIFITGIEPSFADYTITHNDEFHYTRLLYFELRGPPSIA